MKLRDVFEPFEHPFFVLPGLVAVAVLAVVLFNWATRPDLTSGPRASYPKHAKRDPKAPHLDCQMCRQQYGNDWKLWPANRTD